MPTADNVVVLTVRSIPSLLMGIPSFEESHRAEEEDSRASKIGLNVLDGEGLGLLAVLLPIGLDHTFEERGQILPQLSMRYRRRRSSPRRGVGELVDLLQMRDGGLRA